MGIVVWLLSNLLLVQPIRGQEAWFANAASAYYAAGRNHEAERMAREAIKINQNYADAWVNLGAALYAQNRPDEAKEAWTNALKFAPDHLMALRNLALAVEQEDPQQALRLWQRALTAARAQHASPQTISAITAQIHRLQ
jgi:tetratricopeptide (TPR) repeat protein